MLPLTILGVLIVMPIVLLFLLRSSAAVVFLALCAGTVLLRYVGADSSLFLDSLWPNSTILAQEALNICLLLLPASLTMVLLRKSVSGPMIFLNLLPAVPVGCLVALSTVPLLSVITRDNIMGTGLWAALIQFQDFIVGMGVLVSLLLMRTSHKKSSKGHGKGHK